MNDVLDRGQTNEKIRLEDLRERVITHVMINMGYNSYKECIEASEKLVDWIINGNRSN